MCKNINLKISFSLFIFIVLSSFTYQYKTEPKYSYDGSKYLITDSTYKCTVVTIQKNVYENVSLYGLSDSSVKVFKNDFNKEILISDIKSITFNKRGFWKGAAIGAGIGFGIGLIGGGKGISLTDDGGSNDYNIGTAIAIGTIIAIPFGLIGGGLGALFAEEKFYDLSKPSFTEKQKKIEYLIKEYSDR